MAIHPSSNTNSNDIILNNDNLSEFDLTTISTIEVAPDDMITNQPPVNQTDFDSMNCLYNKLLINNGGHTMKLLNA
jgi:hypothetical protein